jgi:hypothetical protein
MTVASALTGEVERCLAGPEHSLGVAADSGFHTSLSTRTIGTALPADFVKIVGGSDIVVSIMNREAAEIAARADVPCLFVDMLLWMWHRPPALPGAVVRYFAEDFPGVRERAVRWRDRLPQVQVIPPLIIPGIQDSAPEDHVLVNFGGMSTWMISPDHLLAYAQAMTECVAEALANWAGPITVAVGSHLLAPLRARVKLARADVRLVSLSHRAYLDTLRRSRLLVTSPGLHAVYEAFARRIPCLLLPPQNLSQVLTLRVLRDLRVLPMLDWEELYGLINVTTANEQRSCARIAACFERFREDRDARARLVAHLRRLLPRGRRRTAVIEAQDAFFAAYGGRDGGNRIAECIDEILR